MQTVDVPGADSILFDCEKNDQAGDCFHCGLPIIGNPGLSVSIDGKQQPMCCHGCKAVAEAIVDAGQSHYYRIRSSPSATALEPVPDFLQQLKNFDDPALQKQFTNSIDGQTDEIHLMLEGITCGACVWLIEQH